MDFKGILRVTRASEKNKAGQYPLSVKFIGEEGISLAVLGARVVGEVVLDPTAISGGRAFKHTSFSPALQAAILSPAKEVVDEVAKKSEEYQKRTDAEMLERSKKAQGL